jgi:preprotein translocase subunit SecG
MVIVVVVVAVVVVVVVVVGAGQGALLPITWWYKSTGVQGKTVYRTHIKRYTYIHVRILFMHTLTHVRLHIRCGGIYT